MDQENKAIQSSFFIFPASKDISLRLCLKNKKYFPPDILSKKIIYSVPLYKIGKNFGFRKTRIFFFTHDIIYYKNVKYSNF